MVKSQAGELLPQGASTTLDPNKSPLSGHYHTIPEGSPLPDGLGIKLDGRDVIPGFHMRQVMLLFILHEICQ